MIKFLIAIALLVFVSPQALANDHDNIKPAEDTVEYAAVVASSSTIDLPIAADAYGIGSRFGDPGDKWIGGRMACAPHNYVSSTAFVCAHRNYPCGTILIVEYPVTGIRSWCVVADRGPYGASVFAPNGKVITSQSGTPAWYVKPSQGSNPPNYLCPDGGCTGRWKGVIDMSPAVSKAMGHPGMGTVKVWRLKRVVDYQKYIASKKSNTTI